RGKHLYSEVENLELIHTDLFAYQPDLPFDLITSARVLQWLKDPTAALEKFKTMLRPGGYISILDYDHTSLEWQPAPPQSMQHLYAQFLQWRADVGMNNQMAEDLPRFFQEIGLEAIEVIDANETYRRGAANFLPKIGIWTKVAESRGKQLVEDGYLTEAERLQAIAEYEAWIAAESEQMIMKLKEVRGRVRQ
ncbi:MAG: methyltransferase domain-containing protein, partial [Bacteroidota bacterium]